MALAFFYKEDVDPTQDIILDEDTSKHIVQVLRMQNGEQLQLTNGKGNLFTAIISDNNRKKCIVKIQATEAKPRSKKVTIAISLIKNPSRFEWFLEKATEIGVTEIILLICDRTERTSVKPGRMKSILISAMLQSQQCWLPVLHEPVQVEKMIPTSSQQQKFIAHCVEDQKRSLADMVNANLSSQIILIGPEGDFSPGEIQLAVQHHFIPVTLGNTRLRTETAGVVAATLLCLV